LELMEQQTFYGRVATALLDLAVFSVGDNYEIYFNSRYIQR